ncbi:MAG: hypothetical protein RLY86_1819 [Pseudomonadota bacterium]|jgi:hypothetical protein
MATRSEEIEREIEATRADMTRTVGAIEQRLSPDGLMDGAMSWLRTDPRGRALVDDVTDVVSRNPLPLVVMGIGLGWLAWEIGSGGRRSVRGHRSMRDRLGPFVPPERHHTHVEDGGHGTGPGGRGPDADQLLGYNRGGISARDAAEAFRDLDRPAPGTAAAGTTAEPVTGVGVTPTAGSSAGRVVAQAEAILAKGGGYGSDPVASMRSARQPAERADDPEIQPDPATPDSGRVKGPS